MDSPLMKKLKFSLVMLLTLLLMLLWAYLKGRHSVSATPKDNATLQPHEKEKISVDLGRNSVTVTTPKGSDVKRGVRNVQITEDDKGNIAVVAPQLGFTFEPGLSAFASSGSGRMGLDANLFYWKDFDLLAGFGVNPSHLLDTVGYVGVGWTPPLNLLSNTDLWAGIDTQKNLAVGIRVAF